MVSRNRGKRPTKSVIDKLYLKAGGRCQFCNKNVLMNDINCKVINNGNVAHIVAASKDGPRGNDKSFELSQEIENLMLLCPECHKLIDTDPDLYTVTKLHKIKVEQEENVMKLLDSLNKQKTVFLMFTSPIKNVHSVHIYKSEVINAIIDNGLIPESLCIYSEINLTHEYKSSSYWSDAEREIENEVFKVKNALRNSDKVLSVFPLAPIPMIIKLGNLLSDKSHVDIYQKFRYPDEWSWQSRDITNNFTFEKEVYGIGNKIALVISITAEIDLNRVKEIDNYDIIYHLKAENCCVNAIQSPKDLSLFWKEYLDVCDLIKNENGSEEISVFPAVPVSAAFEIGRRYMTNVYPKMKIFDESNGFFETIMIGG